MKKYLILRNITVGYGCKIFTNNTFIESKSKCFLDAVHIYSLIIGPRKLCILYGNFLFLSLTHTLILSNVIFFAVSPFNENPFTCTFSSRFFYALIIRILICTVRVCFRTGRTISPLIHRLIDPNNYPFVKEVPHEYYRIRIIIQDIFTKFL
jgi:hypothetical protein